MDTGHAFCAERVVALTGLAAQRASPEALLDGVRVLKVFDAFSLLTALDALHVSVVTLRVCLCRRCFSPHGCAVQRCDVGTLTPRQLAFLPLNSVVDELLCLQR